MYGRPTQCRSSGCPLHNFGQVGTLLSAGLALPHPPTYFTVTSVFSLLILTYLHAGLETFYRSKRGRAVIPPLAHWRTEVAVYDADGNLFAIGHDARDYMAKLNEVDKARLSGSS